MPAVEPIALQLHARPSKWFGANIYRDERHPTSKRGGINRLGPPKNIGASIAASGCHTIGDPVSDRGWKRAFALPSGRELVTLEDAGTYITKLFKAEHEAPEWQAAVEALIA
jgi:hypothetical protein